MRQAARELVKAYIHGVESAALDDVFELLACMPADKDMDTMPDGGNKDNKTDGGNTGNKTDSGSTGNTPDNGSTGNKTDSGSTGSKTDDSSLPKFPAFEGKDLDGEYGKEQ